MQAVGEQLATGGIEDLSVARVAQRAKVSERTIYRYFPAREALFEGLAGWVRGTTLDLPDPLTAPYTRAIIANLCSTATWQALRDEAGMSGAEAGQAAAHAIRTLMSAATNPLDANERTGREYIDR